MSEEIKNSETENIETPAADAAPEKTEAAAETTAPETPATTPETPAAAPETPAAAAAETPEASTGTPAATPVATPAATPRRPDASRGNTRPQHRSSGDRGDRSSYQRPNRFRRKSCRFCHDEKIKIEYKNPDMLEKFITDRGKILPRRITGTCSRHQRALSTEIKRASILALLPFVLQ